MPWKLPIWRPRFSLRSLLLLVTISGIGCWAYSVGWPAYCKYRIETILRAGGSAKCFPQGPGRLNQCVIDGKVNLQLGGVRVLADRVVLWSDHSENEPVSSVKMYAEGAVTIKADGFTAITCDRALMDVMGGRLIIDPEFRTGEQPEDLSARADVMRSDAGFR